MLFTALQCICDFSSIMGQNTCTGSDQGNINAKSIYKQRLRGGNTLLFFWIFPVSSYLHFRAPLVGVDDSVFSNLPQGFLPDTFQSFLNLSIRNQYCRCTTEEAFWGITHFSLFWTSWLPLIALFKEMVEKYSSWLWFLYIFSRKSQQKLSFRDWRVLACLVVPCI